MWPNDGPYVTAQALKACCCLFPLFPSHPQSLSCPGPDLPDDASTASITLPTPCPDPSVASRHHRQVLVLRKLADCCVYLDVIFNEIVFTCKIRSAATSRNLTYITAVVGKPRSANNLAAGSERATEAEDINMIILGGYVRARRYSGLPICRYLHHTL